MSHENKANFIAELTKSLENETFVKASFGKYHGKEPQLKKLLVRLIATKKGLRIFVLYRYETRDTAKNYSIAKGIELIKDSLGDEFSSGHLFTTQADFQIDIGRKGKARLNKAKPTFKQKPVLEHNRSKSRFVDPQSAYLKALGITTESGEIRSRQQDKWRQINKFVETMSGLYRESSLAEDKKLIIFDMGCGKGYLTFAVYDYFKNILGIQTEVTGVDTNSRLMETCQSIAATCEFDGLRFQTGAISDMPQGSIDILIALHACDTATDDAIYLGIANNAKLIVASPCCHKEVRRQLIPSEPFKGILRHGIVLERQSELLTDGIRSLLLEEQGYSTKVFEFVPTEHTPKNNLIAAVLSDRESSKDALRAEIDSLKQIFGIKHQRLEQLLQQ